MMNAKCPRCNASIQLESQNRVGFCSTCGGRVVTQEAIKRFNQESRSELEQRMRQEEQERVLDRSFVRDAHVMLEQGNFDTASSMFMDVWRRDPKNTEAAWGYIRSMTKNLSVFPLKVPADYAADEASTLFFSNIPGLDPTWQKQYYEAFLQCCVATAESVDQRVFVQLEIFRWSPQNHAFMYPVSRDFDLLPVFDKALWKSWTPLRDALPPEYRDAFSQACDATCQRIREYFLGGFTNLETLRGGDLSLLMGAWSLKLTTGATKTDVLNFGINAAKVPYLEAMRCSINYYDYSRAIQVDAKNRITCAEFRHFPSLIGVGGDYVSGEHVEPTITLVALYDFVLVTPTALYTRVAINKISGIDRALAYSQKCATMPCFLRSGKKSAIQMAPMSANYDSAEPSKKVKSCYVATAVYGDEDAPQLHTLRRFRDEKLNTHKLGRRLVALYYRLSPPLARRLKGAKRLNRLFRALLDACVRRMDA